MNAVTRPLATAALTLALWPTAGRSADVLPQELESPNYTKAYVSMGLGVVLTIGSFVVAEQADQAYEDYQQGTDPDAIESDYDRAVTLDKVATASLIAGQAALVLGIYWRFVQRRPQERSAGDSLSSTAHFPESRKLPPRWRLVADPGRLRLGVELRFP
jgi:hypothetical protein